MAKVGEAIFLSLTFINNPLQGNGLFFFCSNQVIRVAPAKVEPQDFFGDAILVARIWNAGQAVLMREAEMNNFLFQIAFVGAMALLATSPVQAQYGERHPLLRGNPVLRNISPGFTIETLVENPSDFKAEWASTYHPAEGKAPPEPDYDKYNDALIADDERVFSNELQKIDAYAEWQSMYSASRAQDGDTTTCWAVAGRGLGEVLIAKVDTMRDVVIYSGFQKSLDLFKKNSRPRRIMVYVLEPTYKEVGQSSISFLQVKVVASQEVELKDTFGQQPLPVPAYWPTTIKAHPDGSPLDDPIYQSLVAVKILSVYPGSKYEDTCISEISN